MSFGAEPRTVWRLVALNDAAGRPRTGLNIALTVDTTALTVVEAIERAAAAAGVQIERFEELPDPPGAGWDE